MTILPDGRHRALRGGLGELGDALPGVISGSDVARRAELLTERDDR
jgi:hypothetical protein